MTKTPDEVIATTSEMVSKIIDEILKIEKQHEYIQNIEQNTSLEKDISEQIIKIIEREISK